MTLEFTTAATEDLQSVRNYILQTWGPAQEKIYLDALWTRFEQILRQPDKFRQRPDLFPGCQIAAQGRHVVLFRIHQSTLQIVRILHSSMDLPRHFPKEP